MLLLASVALAATIDVTAHPSLADAWAAASDGDELLLPSGTHVAEGLVWSDGHLVVRAAEPGVVVLATGGTDGAFFVDDGATLIVEGLQLEGDGQSRLVRADGRIELRDVVGLGGTARRGGCVRSDGGVVWLDRTTLSDCEATELDGGAVDVSGRHGKLLVTHSTLRDSEAAESGGAVACTGASCSLWSTVLSGSTATRASAAYLAGGRQALRGSRVLHHTSTGVDEVGPVWFVDEARMEGTVVCGNTTEGVVVKADDALTVTHSHVVANTGDVVIDGDVQWSPHHLVVAHHGEARFALAGPFGSELAYGLLHDPSDLAGVVLGTGAVRDIDPGLTQPLGGDCSDEALRPLPGSPLVDAGDPAVLDADGTTADIGAFGGPFSDGSVDGDGDGWPIGLDCDDADATVFPAAAEVPADGIDQDCDGYDDCWLDADGDGLGGGDATVAGRTMTCWGSGESPHADDCNDADWQVRDTVWYRDADGDGYGGLTEVLRVCPYPGAGWEREGDDCDDTNPSVHPNNDEDCSEPDVDHDCDGYTAHEERGGDPAHSLYHPDADGDGYGDPTVLMSGCYAEPGWVLDRSDCDDTDPTVHPGGVEVCDDLDRDEDCDGLVDNYDPSVTLTDTLYLDRDRDGYGDPGEPIAACDPGPDRVVDASDCDDLRPHVHPGATDVFGDGIDHDCDGTDYPRATSEPGGCGCTTGGSSAPSATWLLLALWGHRRWRLGRALPRTTA